MSIIRREFDITPDTDATSTGYTIKSAATGQGRYIVQSRCPSDVGVVDLIVEPHTGPAQCVVEWLVSPDEIPQEFLPAVIEGVKRAAVEGVDGRAPAVFLRVLVVGGMYHPVDSRDRSYEVASERALQAALKNAELIPVEEGE